MTTQTMKLLIIIVCMILIWFGLQGIRTGRVREEGDEIIVEIPAQTGHRFRFKSATDSGANRPPVPIQIGRAFRTKSATPMKGEVTLDN